MTEIKATTKKGKEMQHDLFNTYYRGRSFWDVYGRASAAKRRAWEEIERRALATPGYCGDLHICGASSHFFSTIYSYIEDGVRHIVKDTASYTYHTTIPAYIAA